MAPDDSFAAALRVFEAHRLEWSKAHHGQYVVIQDEVIAEGFHATYAEALRAGLQRFGVQRSFLVKQIWKTEPVYLVS